MIGLPIRAVISPLVLSLLCAGCAPSGLPVEGKIMIDGTPAANVLVIVEPSDGTAAVNGKGGVTTTNGEGVFRFGGPAERNYIVAGAYRVSLSRVVNAQGAADPTLKAESGESRETIPEIYRTGATTPLKLEVPVRQPIEFQVATQ